MSVAETILRKVLDKIIEDLKYKHAELSLNRLTSGGANYTSALFAATVTAPDHDTLKLFAKVAEVNGILRKTMHVDNMFKTEHFIYSDLVKVYQRIQDNHNISPEHRFVFPKFFGSHNVECEETIVMEDLTAEGYGTYSRFKPIDWEHAAAAVEYLARFHALSFAYKKDDPENFAKDAEWVSRKWADDNEENEGMKGTWKKMMAAGIQVTKEEHRDKIIKILEGDKGREAFHKFKAPLSTPVLCHGDYRVSNLLFRRLNGRLQPIVVDYQTVHSGSPASDLLYLEFMGTDQQFRKEYHGNLLDHYYVALTAALDRVGIDVNEVYPREALDKEIKQLVPSALIITMVILPLVLVEAEHAPHMGGIKEVSEFAISPGELFAERYSGLVSDCVAWGLI
uniref:CHK kinase-like domain-containing protein n=1 Tax=Heliothis virescens TaxID=7102 RepID=A0A2A4JGC4_HELVI